MCIRDRTSYGPNWRRIALSLRPNAWPPFSAHFFTATNPALLTLKTKVYWYVSVPAITGSSKGGRIPQNLQRRFRFVQQVESQLVVRSSPYDCLLYTSDAADERSSVDLGGRRI